MGYSAAIAKRSEMRRSLDQSRFFGSLGARRLGRLQNSLFGEGLVKAKEFIRQHSDYLVLSK